MSTRPSQIEGLATSRARVLVAIEDPGLRVQLEETLERDGYVLEAAEDGVELLERLSREESIEDVHLVIADVELSGFTGLEVLGLTDAAGRPPVLMLVPRGDAAIAQAARRFGAASVLQRPFDVDELRLVVGGALRPRLLAPRTATRAA